MNDRVFVRIAVAEVAQDRIHVCVAQKLDDLVNAKLIEIDLPFASANLKERAQQFL